MTNPSSFPQWPGASQPSENSEPEHEREAVEPPSALAATPAAVELKTETPARPAGNFYVIDSTKQSIQEAVWSMPRLLAPIAIGCKLARVTLPTTTSDLPVESLLPFEVAKLPEEVETRLFTWLAELKSAGFAAPICFMVEDIRHATESALVVATHASGRAVAVVRERRWHRTQPMKSEIFAEVISKLSDGSMVVTSGEKPELLWPPSIRLSRQKGGSVAALWTRHQAELQQGGRGGAILDIKTTAMARDVIESYHRAKTEFHLSRGLFRPMNETDQQSLARMTRCHDLMQDRPFFERAVYAEMNHSVGAQKRAWGGALALLVISFVLFLFIGRGTATGSSGAWDFLLMLAGVLLVHEGGHYIAMKIFGYRDLKMFFIPMFGAAVTGRATKVDGWKRVLVSLAGPVPGIVIGIGLGVLGLATQKKILIDIGALSLILNGFNLLPFLPLDGGHVMHQVLFCRHALLDVVFRGVTAVGLLGLSAVFNDSLLRGLGIFMAISIFNAVKINRVSSAIQNLKLPPEEETDLNVPPSVAREVVPRVAAAFPLNASVKPVSELCANVYEKMHTRPPGALASIGLLMLHGAAFSAAVIFGSIFIVGRTGSLGGFLNAAAATAQHVQFEPSKLAAWHGDAPPDAAPRLTIHTEFASPEEAHKQFESLRTRLPGTADMLLIGSDLLVAFPAGEDALRTQWVKELEGVGKTVFVVTPDHTNTFSVQCIAPNVSAAESVGKPMTRFFLAPAPHSALVPPWIDPDPRGSEEITRHDRARETYRRVVYGAYEVSNEPAEVERSSQRSKAIADALRLGDQKKVREIQDQIKAERKAAAERRNEALRQDAGLDQQIVLRLQELTRQRDESKSPLAAMKAYSEAVAKEINPLMGRFASDPRKAEEAAAAAYGGSCSQEGCILVLDLAFERPTTGVPALIRWLEKNKCGSFKYKFRPYGVTDSVSFDEEDDIAGAID